MCKQREATIVFLGHCIRNKFNPTYRDIGQYANYQSLGMVTDMIGFLRSGRFLPPRNKQLSGIQVTWDEPVL